MKVKLRNIIIPFLIVMLMVALAGSCEQQNIINKIGDVIRGKNTEISSWRDESGRNHELLLSTKASKKVLVITHQKELDSLKSIVSGLKKNLSNLQSYTTVTITATDTLRIIATDTIIADAPVKHFTFNDPFLYLDGDVFSDNTVSLIYRSTTPIRIVNYRRGYGFLRLKKEDVVEVISDNPRATLTGITNVVIKERPKRFGLGINVGYGTRGTYFGLGISYNLITF